MHGCEREGICLKLHIKLCELPGLMGSLRVNSYTYKGQYWNGGQMYIKTFASPSEYLGSIPSSIFQVQLSTNIDPGSK